MAHEIVPATHPNMAHFRIIGTLAREDITCDDELGLNTGKPRAVLLDVTEMKVWLPDDFIEIARRSFFVNPNLLHLAVVITSPLLRSAALMVAKLTQRRDRLTLHPTAAAAEAHLLALMRNAGL